MLLGNRTKRLRKYALPKKGIIKRDLIFYILISLLLNTLFIFIFDSLHDHYGALTVVFLINAFLANKLLHIQTQAFIYHYKGRRRIAKGVLAALFGVLFPFYGLYLYALAFKERESDRASFHQLFSKPVSLCFVFSLCTLFLGKPAHNILLKTQMAPELGYIGQVGMESWEIISLKNNFERECLSKGDSKCLSRKFEKELFPATNTGIILATAVDALYLFKRKDQAKKELSASIDAGLSLLENQRQFVYQNSCRRESALHFIGPISLLSGPLGVYILQGVDGMISRRYEIVASEKLSRLSESMMKQDLPKEQYRKIASLKSFYEAPSKRCLN